MSLPHIDRRSMLRSLFYGPAAMFSLEAFNAKRCDAAAAIGPNDNIKVTKIESFVLKSSWVFVKISTDAGVTGWGEMLKDDAKACAAGGEVFVKSGRRLCRQPLKYNRSSSGGRPNKAVSA